MGRNLWKHEKIKIRGLYMAREHENASKENTDVQTQV